jgi:glycine betaine/proline transport system substrate-binding protein
MDSDKSKNTTETSSTPTPPSAPSTPEGTPPVVPPAATPSSTPTPAPASPNATPPTPPNPPGTESKQKSSSNVLFLVGGLLILAAAVLGGLYFFMGHKSEKNGQDKTATAGNKPVIKLAVNPWQASELNAAIAKIILEEKMGYKVQLIQVDEYKQWPALAKGELDGALEVWPSGHTDDIKKYIDTDKSVEDGGPLGPVGKIGWYIPKYLVEQHPDLATWKGFADPKNTALFASGSANGTFYTGDPTWTQYDDQIIKNLHLPFAVKTLGSEDALIKQVDLTYNKKLPIVFYFWTPHWAHAVYDLVPVELPAYTDDCYKNLKGGVNCDYPKDPLKKVFATGLKTKAPDAYQFLKKFNYTNEDQIRMLASEQLKKQKPEEVARNWINNNEAVWSLWIQ